MLECNVHKDLLKVKTKVLFHLTKRQLICFSIAAVVGIPVYFLTRNYMDSSMAAMLMITVMLPFFFLGMYEKDGLTLEKRVGYMIRQKYIYPPVRVYKKPLKKGEHLSGQAPEKARTTAKTIRGGKQKKPERAKKCKKASTKKE